jgi:glutamate synthase domain-containing protein 3
VTEAHWEAELKGLIERPCRGNRKAARPDILQNWDLERPNFVQVCPKEMLDKLEHPLDTSGPGGGDLGPPCLTPGVLVDTAKGRLPVEALTAGMMVHTLDRGLRPVLWVGRSDLRADPKHAPVRFEKGAVGNTETFDVSPQHRMHVGGWQAELNFGLPEVLVSAVHLVGLPGVTRRPASRVTYLHVLLERHEIIRTAGTWSESYFPGTSLERHEDEIRRQMPKRFAAMAANMRTTPLARPQVRGRDARVLVA